MRTAALDLMRELLDHEIVDGEGVSCGMVDDVEFEQRGHGPPRVAWLVVGPGAWTGRLPALANVLVNAVYHAPAVRVAWAQVEDVGEVIRLKSSAASLGLGKVDRRLARWLAKLPLS